MIAILLSSRDFRKRDIYIDYPYEDAKFRWERDTGKVYRRFYGKEETEIPHSSDLFSRCVRSRHSSRFRLVS
jgi:hypothetical protein